MTKFELSEKPLQADELKDSLRDPAAGGFVSFEGWVRNENEGRTVHRLEYEAYPAMAEKEGQRIVSEAIERFGLTRALCVHRVGGLEIGDMAVWVGTSSPHRGEAFEACRFIIDQIKVSVPIWKKEHYTDGDSGWVNCERCAEHGHEHAAHHAHGPGTPAKQ
jgi:molybdopterin synthase catalytic subunit